MFSDPAANLSYLRLDTGMDVADLGAGSGFYSIAAAKAIGTGKVYAIEVVKDLLPRLKNAAAQEGVHNIEVVWGDVETPGGTRLRDASVDRVIVSNILFQVEHKDAFAAEALRILKPGGLLMLIDWSDARGGGGPSADRVVTIQHARDLFTSASAQFELSFDAGDHHYGVIFKK